MPFFRRALSSFLVCVLIVFSIEIVLPIMVWCHRADGKIALEFEIVASGCHCDTCELCRERQRTEPVSGRDGTRCWKASHCLHDTISSETESLALAPEKKRKNASLSSPPAVVNLLQGSGFLPPIFFFHGREADPPGLFSERVVLRC